MRRPLAACFAFLAGCGSPAVVEPDAPRAGSDYAPVPAAIAAEEAVAGVPAAAVAAAQQPVPSEPLAFVFVHGWSNDARVWSEVAPLLEGRARLLAVDLPGHGLAAAAPDGDYSLAAQAQAVADAMDARGIGRAVLIGHSSSALVVRQFYRSRAERALGLVFVDGSLSAFPGMADYVGGMAERLDSPEREAALEEIFAGLPLAGLEERHRDMLHEMLLQTPGAVQAETLRATLAPGAYGGDTIAAPVLLVMANSPFWGEEYRAQVQLLCPDLQAEWWSGVSHWLMLDRPSEFSEVLLGWAQRFGAR